MNLAASPQDAETIYHGMGSRSGVNVPWQRRCNRCA